MTVKHVTGDIFALDVDGIGHGVNCKGVMGAGIAVKFKEEFPEMYGEYRVMCHQNWLQLGQVFTWIQWHKGTTHPKNVVYNIASQFEPGANADLDAIMVGILFVEFDAQRRGLKTVALPQIGCGIGGLEWEEVSRNLTHVLSISPVEFQLVTYEAPKTYPPAPPPPTGLYSW